MKKVILVLSIIATLFACNETQEELIPEPTASVLFTEITEINSGGFTLSTKIGMSVPTGSISLWIYPEGSTKESIQAREYNYEVSSYEYSLEEVVEGLESDETYTLEYFINGKQTSFFTDKVTLSQSVNISISESSNNPDSSIIRTDVDDESGWIQLHTFNIEVEEGASSVDLSLLVSQLSFLSGKNPEDVISDLRLDIKGEYFNKWNINKIDTKFMAFFDTGKMELKEGHEYEATIEAKLRKASEYNEGEQISSVVSSEETQHWVITGETGNKIQAKEISGSSQSNIHYLYSVGVSTELVDNYVTVHSDYIEFSFAVDVEVFGGDISLSRTVLDSFEIQAIDTATENGVNQNIDASSIISFSQPHAIGSDGNEYYQLKENEKIRLHINIYLKPDPGSYRCDIKSITFTTEDITKVNFSYNQKMIFPKAIGSQIGVLD